jgi:thioesterase domain-containing protein
VSEISHRAGEQAEVLAAIESAWAKVLPGCFDPTQTWEEAGGDSLASLHLLLTLEQALGRKLSFDAIAPDMTAADMARAIGAPVFRATPAAAVPTVFLLPGIHGDEPRLADFRRSFGGRLHFELIELPELDQSAALLSDVRATARLTAEEIQRRAPRGDILLAGFSFGGCVAFEAAHHLRAAQRTVAWIAILDTAFVSPYGRRRFLRPDILFVQRLGASDRRRPALLVAVDRFWPQRRLGLRRELLQYFRKRAINCWDPMPLPVPAFLAVSQPEDPAKVQRWRALCSGIGVVELPGHHLALFESPSIELLAPAFEAGARAACAAQSATPVPA